VRASIQIHQLAIENSLPSAFPSIYASHVIGNRARKYEYFHLGHSLIVSRC
jgi:hypothetical protein